MTLCHTKMVALTEFIFVQIKGYYFFFQGSKIGNSEKYIDHSINQSIIKLNLSNSD